MVVYMVFFHIEFNNRSLVLKIGDLGIRRLYILPRLKALCELGPFSVNLNELIHSLQVDICSLYEGCLVICPAFSSTEIKVLNNLLFLEVALIYSEVNTSYMYNLMF